MTTIDRFVCMFVVLAVICTAEGEIHTSGHLQVQLYGMLFGCRPICTLLHVHMGARRGARVGVPFLENNFLLYEGLFF